VPEAVSSKRLARLLALQDQWTLEQHQAEIGKASQVLFTYESSKEPNVYYGRTEQFRLVKVASQQALAGKLLPVRMTHANKTALLGELV
jgi:tRNA-2-methylthio-N6-dimethylallyladenosine synthase